MNTRREHKYQVVLQVEHLYVGEVTSIYILPLVLLLLPSESSLKALKYHVCWKHAVDVVIHVVYGILIDVGFLLLRMMNVGNR